MKKKKARMGGESLGSKITCSSLSFLHIAGYPDEYNNRIMISVADVSWQCSQ